MGEPPPQNDEKRADREAYLRDNPDKKIAVKRAELQEIIQYVAFICNPTSSASTARRQAIQNSDIDGGTVISEQPATEEQIQRFIKALRGRGFHVYSPTERAEARRRRAKDSHLITSSNPEEKAIGQQVVDLENLTRTQTIEFTTVRDYAQKKELTEERVKNIGSNVDGA